MSAPVACVCRLLPRVIIVTALRSPTQALVKQRPKYFYTVSICTVWGPGSAALESMSERSGSTLAAAS